MMRIQGDGRWTITWRSRLRSPPAKVHALLATDAGRNRYWCAESTQVGASVRMRFRSGVVEVAEIVACDPPTLLVLRYFDSLVTFRLRGAGTGTDLLLVNEGVSEQEASEVHAGWLNVLFPLKAIADAGVDLRCDDPACTWGDGYLDG